MPSIISAAGPRRFLRSAWAWLAAAGLSLPAAALEPLAVTQLAPSVYVHFGRQEEWGPANEGAIANLGFIVGTRCVAVIDSGGSPRNGERLRASIRRVTALPVCYVINTHVHADHVMGNIAFVPEHPKFVAHARYATAMAGRAAYTLNQMRRDFGVALPDAAIVYPDIRVDDSLTLDLGGRQVRLRAWPPAHTDHDLIALDLESGTLFAGDLLFAGRLPVVDGSLKGWIAVMEQMRTIPARRVVPGHGPASSDWPAALEPQAVYLNALLTETRAAIKAHLTIRQAVDRVGYHAAASWLLSEPHHRRNVTTAYAELEWE